ncbi:protein ANTAGONIST OF LIKE HETEROCHROMATIN PROTEIN 1-like isoform X2 [Sitophilus oryzae]|uniref:Protein ANTAGONIST OF LIKE HETEROCHROMATIN PROTEIN 1-like isoform X2 n=1 Tax=Sitophilus oryzae TaxID=7048 RepID=A0A6J2XRI9_SITOR|nr:protein ANTAGONIST OF LIKE HETEROCHROMATIN PROTEIN 1-like isoform X2 [Sitophilus oryzae]
MKLSKKEIAIISAMYFMCASSIVLNATLILMEWKRRKRERNCMKMQLLTHQLLVNKALIENLKKRKRSKNKKRSYEWWENIVKKEFSEKDWLENFRVGKDSFRFIVEELKEELKPKENFLNNARIISCVEKKVAVALFYLASVCEYRVVGHTFGIHKSTYIKIPSEAEAIEIASYFERSTHLPNIIGAIDETHIPVRPPTEGHRDFINRKGWASIILQGVVDSKYRFWNICIKNPGSTHDASVLAGSAKGKYLPIGVKKSVTLTYLIYKYIYTYVILFFSGFN